jgi:quercetin dioxygenase-like cupin family protein
MPFVRYSDISQRDAFPGVRGRYAHGDKMTAGLINLDANIEVPSHAHPHEQFTIVVSGCLEFTLGDETREMTTGDAVLIPGGVRHGVKTQEACVLLDVFSPVREDFR